jgi:signal transduction histidine kinase
MSLDQNAKKAWYRVVIGEGKNRQILQLKGEIERLQVSLESQGRGLGLMQLASGVAHEINNPLSYIDSNLQRFGEYFLKIAGYIKSLEGQLEFVDEKAFHAATALKHELDLEFVLSETPVMLNEAKDGINRVKEIVKDLVALARPEQVSREIKSPTDLNGLIDSTLRVLSAKITPGVTIEKRFGLKEKVPVYPVRLSQALMNLVSNGLQALDGEGTLIITTRRDGESALIEVQDDGPGISQEVLAQIFLPFFTTKEAGKGSGLGLSIARSFVEMHRGELIASSQLGEGARFLIRIPIDDTDTQTSMLKSTNPQHEVFH